MDWAPSIEFFTSASRRTPGKRGERLWRSLKYECVYLHAFETASEARAGIGKWITYYNAERPHSALGGRTPLEAQAGYEGTRLAA